MYQKITGIVAMLFVVTCMVSCGDDEEVLKEDQLTGNWSLESQEIRNVTANAQGFSFPLDDVPEVRNLLDTIAIFPENATITFNENKSYVVTDPSISDNALQGTWSLDETGETLTINGLDDASQFLGSNSLSFTIQEFTDTNLSLLASIPDITLPDDIDIPNVPNIGTISLSADYQLDLKKQ